MKLDGATIPIERRNFSETLGLALRLYWSDRGLLLPLTLLFAAPVMLATFIACEVTELGLFVAWVSTFLVAPFLGAAIVAASGPRVFGEPVRLGGVFRTFRSLFGVLVISLLPLRITVVALTGFLLSSPPEVLSSLLLMFALPLACLVHYRDILRREVLILERLRGTSCRRRLKDLRLGVSGEILGLLFCTVTVSVYLVAQLFLLVDLFSGAALGAPILLRRFEGGLGSSQLLSIVLGDPLFVTTLVGVVWVVYPLARLCLFLSYLDLRILKECWDLELDFRIEAQRLEGRY